MSMKLSSLANASRWLSFLAAHPRSAADARRWLPSRGTSPLALPLPLLPSPLIRWLAENLPPDARAFEFGAGGSTLWLSEIVGSVVSVEHDQTWHAQLASRIPPNVQLIHVAGTDTGTLTSSRMRGVFFDDYVSVI